MRLQGSTVEQKLKSAERVLDKLQKRKIFATACAIPPIPLSFYVDEFPENLMIARYIFPARGELVRALVYSEFADKPERYELKSNMQGSGGGTQKSFHIRAKHAEIELELPINAGDRLEVSLDEKPEGLNAIWIGMLYRINMKDTELKQFADTQQEMLDERVHSEV